MEKFLLEAASVTPKKIKFETWELKILQGGYKPGLEAREEIDTGF